MAAAARPVLVLLALCASIPAAWADTDLQKGADAYRICYNCHSLKPGVHLTGPSLAGLWGRKAASMESFARYSTALKSADFNWTEETLHRLFEDPQALVPGTTMILRGIPHEGVRANLVAFLRFATGPDGFKAVIEQGLLSEELALGRVPEMLRDAGPERQVTSIRHCGDNYVVATADGNNTQYWERNLHFKTDTSERGPQPGKPVLVQIGSIGDRASVVFAAPDEMETILQSGC